MDQEIQDQEVEDTYTYTFPPRYPEGTPEYDAYRAELRAELAKWVRREPPYN